MLSIEFASKVLFEGVLKVAIIIYIYWSIECGSKV
jgi:hypothetical protein